MKNQVTVEKLNLSFECSVEKNTSEQFVSRSFLLVEAIVNLGKVTRECLNA